MSQLNIDAETEMLVEEFIDLDMEIKRLQAYLNEKKKRRDEIGGFLSGVFRSVSDIKGVYLKTKKYVMEVASIGGERMTHKYSELFNLALSKVNRRTRAVLERIQAETGTVYHASDQFRYSEFNEGMLNEASFFAKLGAKIKNFLGNLKRMVFGVKKDFNELEQISKKILR